MSMQRSMRIRSPTLLDSGQSNTGVEAGTRPRVPGFAHHGGGHSSPYRWKRKIGQVNTQTLLQIKPRCLNQASTRKNWRP